MNYHLIIFLIVEIYFLDNPPPPPPPPPPPAKDKFLWWPHHHRAKHVTDVVFTLRKQEEQESLCFASLVFCFLVFGVVDNAVTVQQIYCPFLLLKVPGFVISLSL